MSMHFSYSEKVLCFAVSIIWKYFSKGRANDDEMS